MLITGRLVALAAAFSSVVLVLPVGWPYGLLVANAVLVMAWFVDRLLAVAPSSVEVERALPPRLTMGERSEIEWVVKNPVGRRLRAGVVDALPPSFDADRRRVQVRLPGSGRAVASTSFAPRRRGRFDIDEMTVRTWGPLGLAARQRRRSLSGTLRVYPPFASRNEAELRINKARILEVGLRSVRAHGGGTEFDQLREYGVDDDARRIDWAATARTGKPIVRTYRAERNQNVVTLLDTGRVMAGRVAGVPRLEHAMDAVMTLSTVAARLGDRVGLLAFDRDVRAEVAAATGRSHPSNLVEAMYRLEPELVESDYRRAFVHAVTRFRRRSLMVVITDLAEHSVAEALLPALPLLTRNHVVIVAAVSDPEVGEWARAVPLDASKAFRKAASLSALDDRRRTIACLRSRGAIVVDADPGRLPAMLADRYLDMKATGSL